jgi:predicted MFS family arabinose efflux permease
MCGIVLVESTKRTYFSGYGTLAISPVEANIRKQITSTGAKRYALAVLVVVYTFNFIDRQILAILLPAIKAEFTVDDKVLGFLAGPAFAVLYATLGIPIAFLADRSNRRNLIALALAIWSGMTALSGVASNILQLVLARIGVGIGEAGCSPPAHSMIADYYPPERRSTAMGLYTLGISAGIMIAYLAGGWVAEHIGWREAFFIVGIPGLLLALLVRFTVEEPVRGVSENRIDSDHRPGVVSVARFLFGRKSFLHMAAGAGLASFSGYAVLSFYPSFLVRSFTMSLSTIGVSLGLILGIAGGIGFAGGGYLADKIGQKSHRTALWAVAASLMISWVFVFPVYLASSGRWSLIAFIPPMVLSNVYLATTFAQTQSLVPLRMRSVASALLLFLINIVGLGLGPQLAGILSDFLANRFGIESLRYSLLIIGAVLTPWTALHYFIAGRHIEQDLARADEID